MGVKLKTFEEYNAYLIGMAEKLGGIPKKQEVEEDRFLPNVKVLRRIYRENVGIIYSDYLLNLGFTKRKPKIEIKNKITYKELFSIWDDFYIQFKRFPNSIDCYKNKNLPNWETVKKICGNQFDEFYNFHKQKENKMKYDAYCKIFIDESNKLGRYLTIDELNNKNEYSKILPSGNWFINNSPYKEIKTYSGFIRFLGFKPKFNISKEDVVRIINEKYINLKRSLKQEDFINLSDESDISISVIKRFWGNFNNMLNDLGLPINQENMIIKSKNIGSLKEDIIKLCNYIEATENRKNISSDDINNCEWCLSHQVYNKRFKESLNITLGEFIASIGYIPNNIGMGMIYRFDDGEVTKSKFEYEVSTYLRGNNILYKRNIRYDLFISDYTGNKDCDYVIDDWYVEIAGLIEHEKYRQELNNKINMLESEKLNYKIIYPKDFKTKSMKEIFSFLNV